MEAKSHTRASDVTSAIAAPLPGPRGLPLVGVLPQFRRNAAEFLGRMAHQYGDLVRLQVGPQTIFLVNHPDWIKDILVTHQSRFKKSRMLERARVLLGDGLLTSEGEHHKRQRRLVQPAFHRERLAGYAGVMAACAADARAQWRDGENYDVATEMMRLTLSIVTRTLFSADIGGEADEIGEALTQVFELFGVILLPFSEYLEKLPLPSVRRFQKARERLDRTIYRIIRERRESGTDKGDLLSMLLAAQDEEGSGGMTDSQVRDEALTLFLAGHETTANALTWTWYLLSQNPAAEAGFHEELDRVLAGRIPAMEDVAQLKYTESIFAEALRLYPPAWGVGRRALEDYPVGGYTIPARCVVLMSPYVVQRDPRWFPEPLAFRPERWMGGAPENADRPKFSYFPFGGGSRVCIGERFAWTEGVLLLATIGQHWRLRLAPGHRVETKPVITLRTKYGMRMVAQRRPGIA
jgi:cytochrome P450